MSEGVCLVCFEHVGKIERWKNFNSLDPEATQPCLGDGHAQLGSVHFGDLPRESVSA